MTEKSTQEEQPTRNVTFRTHEDFFNMCHGHNGQVHKEKAIGYLVRWAMHNPKYRYLNLYGDIEGNLHAFYKEHDPEKIEPQDNPATYFIFGQIDREDGSYSFHS